MFDAFYNAMRAIGYTHNVHSTQVHMPIGLVIGAFVLGALSFLLFRWPRLQTYSPFRASSLAAAGQFCIILSFLFWFTSIGSAIMDWQYFFAGAWLFPIKVKMGLAGAFLILLCAAMIIGFRTEGFPLKLLVLYAAMAITVVALGFFGGEVAYGIRVPPAPKQYQAGQYVFQSNCVGCHPGGSNNLKPTMAIWGSPMLMSSAVLVDFLRHPGPPMPPFPPQKISEQEAKNLYQYLHAVMGR